MTTTPSHIHARVRHDNESRQLAILHHANVGPSSFATHPCEWCAFLDDWVVNQAYLMGRRGVKTGEARGAL